MAYDVIGWDIVKVQAGVLMALLIVTPLALVFTKWYQGLFARRITYAWVSLLAWAPVAWFAMILLRTGSAAPLDIEGLSIRDYEIVPALPYGYALLAALGVLAILAALVRRATMKASRLLVTTAELGVVAGFYAAVGAGAKNPALALAVAATALLLVSLVQVLKAPSLLPAPGRQEAAETPVA